MHKTTKHTSDHGKGIASFFEKIVIDVGIGRLSSQPNFEEKILPQVMRDVALISGQKPASRPAKKSIAGFKTRQGQVVGLKVTLRGKRMVDFFERMIKMVLPRVKDFGGIKLSAVDDGGSLNIGLREQLVFSEVSPELSPTTFSLGVTVVPKVKNKEKAMEKYRSFGVPLKNPKS
ncbi:MAG: 50S ribosomal protein L5 [Patescibacteria group bacterium]